MFQRLGWDVGAGGNGPQLWNLLTPAPLSSCPQALLSTSDSGTKVPIFHDSGALVVAP